MIMVPRGYQQLTGMNTATALTLPQYADRALISCDSAAGVSARYRDDGTPPTATVGMELLPGQSVLYIGNLAALQFIQVAAGAIVNVLYYS